jgi:hypothetical protein
MSSPDDIIASLRAYSRARPWPGNWGTRGSRNGKAVLTEEQVWQIKRLIEQGVRPKVIMKKFATLSNRNYWHIASGKNWGHVK